MGPLIGTTDTVIDSLPDDVIVFLRNTRQQVFGSPLALQTLVRLLLGIDVAMFLKILFASISLKVLAFLIGNRRSKNNWLSNGLC